MAHKWIWIWMYPISDPIGYPVDEKRDLSKSCLLLAPTSNSLDQNAISTNHYLTEAVHQHLTARNFATLLASKSCDSDFACGLFHHPRHTFLQRLRRDQLSPNLRDLLLEPTTLELDMQLVADPNNYSFFFAFALQETTSSTPSLGPVDPSMRQHCRSKSSMRCIWS